MAAWPLAWLFAGVPLWWVTGLIDVIVVPIAVVMLYYLRRTGGIRVPRGFGKVVGRLVAERGWTSPVAVGSVMAEWATLVGPEISAHCTPESFTDTTLHVRTDSTAWATQLRLLSISLLEKFRTELGDGVVTSIQVLGPSAPSWRKGGRTVNGRGPRDTYG